MDLLPRRRLLLSTALIGILPARGQPPAATPLRLAYYDNFAPFSQLRDGRMAGIFIDIMDELLVRRLGLPVRHEGYPWARAQQRVRQGEADAFITVPTAERLAYTVASKHWVTQGCMTMFVRADSPLRARLQSVRDARDLRDISLGSYLGNGWVKARFAGREVHYSSSRAQALKMLLAGRFEVLVDSSNAMQAALHATGLSREVVELAPVLASSETRLMLARRSPYASRLGAIDAELRRMRSDGTLARLSRPPAD